MNKIHHQGRVGIPDTEKDRFLVSGPYWLCGMRDKHVDLFTLLLLFIIHLLTLFQLNFHNLNIGANLGGERTVQNADDVHLKLT